MAKDIIVFVLFLSNVGWNIFCLKPFDDSSFSDGEREDILKGLRAEIEKFKHDAECEYEYVKSRVDKFVAKAQTDQHGSTGQKGDPGERGAKGEVGFKGKNGEKGILGNKGGIGSIGQKGRKGVAGQIGQYGDIGAKGEAGSKGEKGEKGIAGNKGEIGSNGENLEMGVKGQKGESGGFGSCSSYIVLSLLNENRSLYSNSSTWGKYHGPDRALLYSEAIDEDGVYGAAWSAGTSDKNQYLQIDMLTKKNVTGVVTQGRISSNSAWNQWVTKYRVLYSTDCKQFTYVGGGNGEEFNGNTDQSAVKENMFNNPVIARCIRINPTEWHVHISMRADVIGCFLPSDRD